MSELRRRLTVADPLWIGTKTRWGKVAAVGTNRGGRFYMMAKRGVVTLMPADLLEAEEADRGE